MISLKTKALPVLIVLFAVNVLFAQQDRQRLIDSLRRCISVNKEDTTKVRLLVKLGTEFRRARQNDSALAYAKEAIRVSKKSAFKAGNADANYLLGRITYNQGDFGASIHYFREAQRLYSELSDEWGLAETFNAIGSSLDILGNFDGALKHHELALKIREKIHDSSGIASSYNNIGNIYDAQGNYPEAMKFHFRSLKISEKLNNTIGVARSNNNIGVIQFELKNYEEAIRSIKRAIELYQILDETSGVASCYMTLGNICVEQHRYREALDHYSKALDIGKNDIHLVSICYNGVGTAYYSMNNYKEALRYYFLSLDLKKEMDDRQGMSTSYVNIASAYNDMKNYDEAEKYANQSKEIAMEMGILETIKNASSLLSDIYLQKGQHEKSYFHYKDYVAAKDSLINEENTKQLVASELNYEFEKKEAAAKLEHDKKEAIAAAESKKQKIILWSVCGILLTVLFFALFAYRSFLQKKKANQQISRQKHIIEEKQKEILDSIYYARRIQRALVTSEKYIDKNICRLKDRIAG